MMTMMMNMPLLAATMMRLHETREARAWVFVSIVWKCNMTPMMMDVIMVAHVGDLYHNDDEYDADCAIGQQHFNQTTVLS